MNTDKRRSKVARFLKVAPIALALAVGMRAGRIDFGPSAGAALPAVHGSAPPGAPTETPGMDDSEPSVAVLMGTGLVVLGLVARRRWCRFR